MDETGGGKNFINEIRDVAVIAAMVVTSLVYPVLVVAMMRHPAVVALFQRGGSGFSPMFREPVGAGENAGG